MSFLDWFRRKKKIEVVEENIQPVVLTDPSAINHYVINLCEQMIDISREMEDVRREYDQVTSYLNDITIVEGLEGPQKEMLVDVATNVSKLTKARNDYLNAEHKISDDTFNQMDELEAEVPDIIKSLKSNETYLDAIKRDLNNLAGEKVEWSVLRNERAEEQSQLRKLSYLLLYIFGGAAVIVTVLSIMMKWEMLPIIIVAFLATLAGAYIMIRMQECAREIKKCDVNLNHAISLENRVKIKYVNIKNAVDYTCERFHVNNSLELTYNYEQYIEACKEREKFKQTNEDLEYFNGRLVRILQGLHLYDARIWLNYANAVIDPREMVEVKHDLFSRRQKLRSRIEYNLNAIEDMKQEVEKYIDKMGSKTEQVRTILMKVDEINRGAGA
ncbi:MAG: hypothetical protein IJ419_15295 [Agathobacter sp.]|nr:hypothetical protein [Agathobacter sp.]